MNKKESKRGLKQVVDNPRWQHLSLPYLRIEMDGFCPAWHLAGWLSGSLLK